MRRGTKKTWFGPNRRGWGCHPVTWQGWLLNLLFVGAALGIASKLGPTLLTGIAWLALLAILLLGAWLAGVEFCSPRILLRDLKRLVGLKEPSRTAAGAEPNERSK